MSSEEKNREVCMRRLLLVGLSCWLAIAISACGDDVAPANDSGVEQDAGEQDAGEQDAGEQDAGDEPDLEFAHAHLAEVDQDDAPEHQLL